MTETTKPSVLALKIQAALMLMLEDERAFAGDREDHTDEDRARMIDAEIRPLVEALRRADATAREGRVLIQKILDTYEDLDSGAEEIGECVADSATDLRYHVAKADEVRGIACEALARLGGAR